MIAFALVSGVVDGLRDESQEGTAPDVKECVAARGLEAFAQGGKISKTELCKGWAEEAPMTGFILHGWTEIFSKGTEVQACKTVEEYADSVTDWEGEEAKKFVYALAAGTRRRACESFDPEEMCECVVDEKWLYVQKCDQDKGSVPFSYWCNEAGGEKRVVKLKKARKANDAVCAEVVAKQNVITTDPRKHETICSWDPLSKDMVSFAMKYVKSKADPSAMVLAHYRTEGAHISEDVGVAVVISERYELPNNKVDGVVFIDDAYDYQLGKGSHQTIPNDWIIEEVPQLCETMAEDMDKIVECSRAEWMGKGCDKQTERTVTFMTTFQSKYCSKPPPNCSCAWDDLFDAGSKNIPCYDCDDDCLHEKI
eukprot:CAMPEP_0172915954 /NCGR_PEP_ID=MMETSP1075-20121228/195279_1 /TAXON_ID=2916 /ORGANISM="Ceratium fusus, Strain PA161109" /LENGTH=366 /DNA_ID=CAMNT_0013775125 /DNA_START=152 /DNA_END=1249 /DNA_ORIENTATION=+